jgi:type II secretory pathway pseudopilin PulG
MLEVLLVIGMMLILFTISVPIMLPAQRRVELYVNRQMAMNVYRRAQILAQNGINDTQWGVRLESTRIILFSGNSYAGRTAALDEIMTLPISITATGPGEIVFSKLYGIPSTDGTVTLSSTVSQTAIININAKGALN